MLTYVDAAFQDGRIVWLATNDPIWAEDESMILPLLPFYLGKAAPLDKEETLKEVREGFRFIHSAVIDAINDAYQKILSGEAPRAGEVRGMYADAQARTEEAQARVDALARELQDAEAALREARAAEEGLRQTLDTALEKITCKNCGYEFPEDSDFKFCPQCAAPR